MHRGFLSRFRRIKPPTSVPEFDVNPELPDAAVAPKTVEDYQRR